jgi:hypothetical protein
VARAQMIVPAICFRRGAGPWIRDRVGYLTPATVVNGGEVEKAMASQRRRPGVRSGRAALFDLLRGLGRLVVIGLPVAIAPSPSPAALVDWLVLLIDASASIDGAEYRLQHEAYVSVLQDPGIGALLEGAKVAVVEFATAPEVVVEWTDDPIEAALAYAGHTRQRAGPGPASTTGIARALGLALDMLEDKAGRKVIDISGDGPDNVDWISAVWSQRERARGLRVEINGLAIPTAEEPGIDVYYAEHVVTGFLEISREHRDFEQSLLMKLHIEIAGTAPE